MSVRPTSSTAPSAPRPSNPPQPRQSKPTSTSSAKAPAAKPTSTSSAKATAPQPSAKPTSTSSSRAPAPAPSASSSKAPAAPQQAQSKPLDHRLDLSSKEAQSAIKTSLDYVQRPTQPQPQPRALLASTTGGSGKDAATAGSGFTPLSVEKDQLGMTHVRMQRTQDGLKVFGEQAVSHLDKGGKVVGLTGGNQPLSFAEGARSVPKVSTEQALATAGASFGSDNPGVKPQGTPKSELVYYKATDGQTHKAYNVQLENLGAKTPLKMNYMVDAQSGKTLSRWNSVDTTFSGGEATAAAAARQAAQPRQSALRSRLAQGDAAAATPSTGASEYSGQVPLSTHKNADGSFSLADDARNGSKTLDLHNVSPDFPIDHNRATSFKDANNVWGERSDDPRAQQAVDAHYGMQETWDFYKNVLGRDSIDGKGEALNSYVHLGQGFNNAFWDGQQMQYGDGDGRNFGHLTTVDIAGHEISHGLTERTAGLNYERESGALNEAWSDIMGKGVQWYASQHNPNVKFNWNVGEQAYTPGRPGDALRYMNDPSRDGASADHYSKRRQLPPGVEPSQRNDNGGVHTNSGIANRAFTLAVDGGTNATSGQSVAKGIGMEKALKAFYRAEAFYLTPNSGFADARTATIQAARDLYGADSAEAKTIAQAWSAVGVDTRAVA